MCMKCILPPVHFRQKKKRRRKLEDRPFPKEDDKVFPRENLYERIILPGKLYHFGNFSYFAEGMTLSLNVQRLDTELIEG